MKIRISESFIFILFYLNVGVLCVYGMFTFFRKILWCQNKFIQIMCAILMVANYVSIFAAIISFLLFCHINHDFRFWSALPFFILYLVYLIKTIKKMKEDGWRGLM